ncbi:MAG: NAD(P)/FAD-dependent oxidoreductase [Vicinamibacterales bacterium]
MTRDGVNPSEFNTLGCRELVPYNVQWRRVGVSGISRLKAGFRVRLADGTSERTRFVLLATGVVDELPQIAGVEECYGRSVFHCPYCDGWEWRDRRIAVVGRNATGAAKLALSLVTWSPDVVFCTNGVRLERRMAGRLRRNGVTIRVEPVSRLVHSRGMLERIDFKDSEAEPCDVLFFTTGQHQQNALAMRLGCEFNTRGTVKTGTLSDTCVPGVFVAGDASRDAQFIAVAVGEGLKAAVAINQALQRETLRP